MKDFAYNNLKFDGKSSSERQKIQWEKKRNFLLTIISAFPTEYQNDLYCRHVKTQVCLIELSLCLLGPTHSTFPDNVCQNQTAPNVWCDLRSILSSIVFFLVKSKLLNFHSFFQLSIEIFYFKSLSSWGFIYYLNTLGKISVNKLTDSVNQRSDGDSVTTLSYVWQSILDQKKLEILI